MISSAWRSEHEGPLGFAGPEIRLKLSGFFFKQGAYDLGWPLPGREYNLAGQIERRIFFVIARLFLEALLRLTEDDAANASPINRASAHGAGFSRGIERHFGKFFERIGFRCA